MVVCLVAKSRLYKVFLLVSFLQCFFGKGIVTVRAVPQLELLNDIVAETAVAEISHTDAPAVYVILQYILKIIACEIVDDEQTFAFALHKFLLTAEFSVLDFDIIFLGEVSP